MIRISLAYLYNVAAFMEPIGRIKDGDKLIDHWVPLYLAESAIEQLIDTSVFSREMRTSRQSALNFNPLIKPYYQNNDLDRIFTSEEVAKLHFQFNQFKAILLAELETLNAHFVTQKRGYDSMALIGYAEIIFPSDLSTKVPEAIPDIREAGKCIAFELPTAACFHLHRANEAIMHKYDDHVSDGKERPKNRNIGGYLKIMNDNNLGDPRLLATLKDLNDLRRNPLIHPDQSLESIDDAIALMNAVHNAAVFMLKAIPVPAVA